MDGSLQVDAHGNTEQRFLVSIEFRYLGHNDRATENSFNPRRHDGHDHYKDKKPKYTSTATLVRPPSPLLIGY